MGIFNRIKEVIRSNSAIEREENIKKKTLFNLKISDVISIEEVDYEIEAIIGFNDHGWKWREYQLKDATKTLWLSVEKDDEIEISIYEEIRIPGFSPSKSVSYKGRNYYLDEEGEAIIDYVKGNLNVVPNEKVHYYEYCDEDDESYLAVEVWGNEVEVSIGREIKEYNVDIYG